jgi:flagellar biosynthetic protein FlhB
MSESEDRTQPASTLRRQQAREQGQVAHSPELTTAAGLVATVIAIFLVGQDLVKALLFTFQHTISSLGRLPGDADGVSAELRSITLGVASPLALIALAATSAALLAHQLQVRGLFVPSLIAPDVTRLWSPNHGMNPAAQLRRSVWGWFKAILLTATAGWVIRSAWLNMIHANELTGAELGLAAGTALLQAVWPLTALLVLLGAIEFGLRYHRFESMLRMTPDEQREDQRTMEGDPAVRAQRRRLVRTWRSDTPELFTGASLVLLGTNGLTLVIAGGPPPARIHVRTVARGAAGLRLRRSPGARQVHQLDAPDLARWLSIRPAAGSITAPELMARLAAAWPRSSVTGLVQEPAEA